MSDHDPPRLTRSGSELGRALAAARARGPSDADVARMAAVLGLPALPPPVPPTSTPPPSLPGAGAGALGGMALGSKLLWGAGLVAAAVAIGTVVPRSSSPAPVAPVAPVSVAPPATATPSATEIAAPVAEAPSVVEEEASAPPPRRHRTERRAPAESTTPSTAPAPAPAPATEAEAETTSSVREEAALIARAERLLGSAPATSLALADEHRARFAAGTLREEREVIAIDALLRLGRRAAAEERAAAFDRTHGASIHARRIQRLLDRAEP